MVRMGNIHNITLHLPIYQALCMYNIFASGDTTKNKKCNIWEVVGNFHFNCSRWSQSLLKVLLEPARSRGLRWLCSGPLSAELQSYQQFGSRVRCTTASQQIARELAISSNLTSCRSASTDLLLKWTS